MALQVQECIEHIQHTLHSGNEVPSIGAWRILNDSGEFLCSMRPWKWLEVAEAKLDLVKDQDFIWLPDDFREMIGQDMVAGLVSGLSMTSAQHIIELRTSSITSSNWQYRARLTTADRGTRATGNVTLSSTGAANGETFVINDGHNPAVTFEFDTVASQATVTETNRSVRIVEADSRLVHAVAIHDAINDAPRLFVEAASNSATPIVTVTATRYGTKSNVTITEVITNGTVGGLSGGLDGGTPRPRLDIYPTPGSDSAGALAIYYRAKWGIIDSDTQFVSVPEWMEGLYLRVLRAFARGYEREDQRTMDSLLNEISAGAQFAGCVQVDVSQQNDYGLIVGGAAELVEYSYDHFWNFNSVANPS